MQVLQWAGTIPIGRRVELGPRALSLWCGHDTDTSKGRNSFLELAGSSRVYDSRGILIECELTNSNSTLLQVSN